MRKISRQMSQPEWQAKLGGWVKTVAHHGEALRGGLDAKLCGDCLLATIETSAQEGLRSSALIKRDGLDHILLHCIQDGTLVFGLDDGLRAQKGDLLVIDLNEPTRIVCSDVTVHTTVFPRHKLAPVIDDLGSTHGLVLSASQPNVQAFRKMLAFAREHGVGASRTVQFSISETFAAIAADSINTGLQIQSDASSVPRKSGKLRTLIAANYRNPHLNAQWLAEQLKISRATVYRMQAEEDHLSLFDRIRHVRVRAALARLAVDMETESLSDIARACGFSSTDQCRRAVEQALGRSIEDLIDTERGDLMAGKPEEECDQSFSWWLHGI